MIDYIQFRDILEKQLMTAFVRRHVICYLQG